MTEHVTNTSTTNSVLTYRRLVRIGLAAAFLIIAVLMACSTMVRAGQAQVISRFGNPVRVITEPGWYLRWPIPIERSRAVDLRLRSTSSGLYSIQMNDGSVITAETYVVWQVPRDPVAIGRFLRAVDNRPEAAASQMRSLLGSGMQSLSGGFAVSDLINSDPQLVKIEDFEQQLQAHISDHLNEFYGIRVASVGCERLMVPETIVAATIDAMIEDRNTLAQEQRSAGLERAGHILSEAQAQSRIMIAEARKNAAQIEAEATRTAADIYATAYQKPRSLSIPARTGYPARGAEPTKARSFYAPTSRRFAC